MSSPALAGADLLAFWKALKKRSDINERDRVTLCAIARAGRMGTASAVAKMCGGRGVTTLTATETLAKHSALVERWSVKVAA